MQFATLVFALVCLFAWTAGCDSASESVQPAAPLVVESPEFIYLGMRDDDAPFVDYEGEGMLIEGATRRPGDEGPYQLELVAIELDPTTESYVMGDEVDDRLLVRLEGEVTRDGEDGFHMRGSLEARRPARVQFVQMIAKGDSSGEEFPELDFEQGRHDFVFDATLVGWLDQ